MIDAIPCQEILFSQRRIWPRKERYSEPLLTPSSSHSTNRQWLRSPTRENEQSTIFISDNISRRSNFMVSYAIPQHMPAASVKETDQPPLPLPSLAGNLSRIANASVTPSSAQKSSLFLFREPVWDGILPARLIRASRRNSPWRNDVTIRGTRREKDLEMPQRTEQI